MGFPGNFNWQLTFGYLDQEFTGYSGTVIYTFFVLPYYINAINTIAMVRRSTLIYTGQYICICHIQRELKFSVNQANTLGDTYENVNTAVNDIIKAHSQVLGKFDLSLKEEMKKTCVHVLEPETTQRS